MNTIRTCNRCGEDHDNFGEHPTRVCYRAYREKHKQDMKWMRETIHELTIDKARVDYLSEHESLETMRYDGIGNASMLWEIHDTETGIYDPDKNPVFVFGTGATLREAIDRARGMFDDERTEGGGS